MNLPEAENECSLAHALVVGNTLGLRRAGILGRKGKHNERNDIRQHVVQRTRQVQRLEEAEARAHQHAEDQARPQRPAPLGVGIAADERRQKIEKEIAKLEKQARAEKQPKKKFELVQQIKKLKKELEG